MGKGHVLAFTSNRRGVGEGSILVCGKLVSDRRNIQYFGSIVPNILLASEDLHRARQGFEGRCVQRRMRGSFLRGASDWRSSGRDYYLLRGCSTDIPRQLSKMWMGNKSWYNIRIKLYDRRE